MRNDLDELLLIEPFGGLAGDMFLAALLDLEDPRFGLADLRELAAALVPGECSVEASRVRRGSIAATLVDVRTAESARPPHRHLADCLGLIDSAPLGAAARARAAAIFRRIAEAEARVHGIEVERVHFHEVGAVDALIDICGAALALERLGVGGVLATPPLVGSGTVECAHGTMPVPAPGTAEILRGLPHRLGGEGERLTPTGAAIWAECADDHDYRGDFQSARDGYGADHRDPAGPPNLVRVRLGRAPAAAGSVAGEPAAHAAVDVGVAVTRGEVWRLAFNLDDMTGEAIGFLVGRLRGGGALEVWTRGVSMKKDRPGVLVEALCRGDRRAALEREAFAHSTTLGVRWTRHERAECERAELTVQVHGKDVRVKRRLRSPGAPSNAFDLKPEYDDLLGLFEHTGVPLAELSRRAVDAARAQLERDAPA